MRTLKEYTSLIHIYQSRLSEMELAHKAKIDRLQAEYKQRRKNFTRKIGAYKKCATDARERNADVKTIKTIERATDLYFGTTIAQESPKMSVTSKARLFYYKICLEEGLCGARVADNVNVSRSAARIGRTYLFTKMKKDKTLIEDYLNYKKYILGNVFKKSEMKKAA